MCRCLQCLQELRQEFYQLRNNLQYLFQVCFVFYFRKRAILQQRFFFLKEAFYLPIDNMYFLIIVLQYYNNCIDLLQLEREIKAGGDSVPPMDQEVNWLPTVEVDNKIEAFDVAAQIFAGLYSLRIRSILNVWIQ